MSADPLMNTIQDVQIGALIVAAVALFGTLVVLAFLGWILLRWVRAYEARGSAKVVNARQVDLPSRVEDDSRYMPKA